MPQDVTTPQTPEGSLSWGLCIATLNRLDSLKICIRCALSQTRMPKEIVIVDASDDWEANKAEIANMLPEDGNIRFVYLEAEMRSLTNQRNQAVTASSSDILFLIDDDSYLFEDTAERALEVYETPTAGRLVALSLASVEASPLDQSHPENENQKTGVSGRKAAEKIVARSSILRWIYREVFLMQLAAGFIKYDYQQAHGTEAEFEAMQLPDVAFTEFISGFALTARRTVVSAEMFEPAFMAYCPGEDLDASYRMGRHGVLGYAMKARVHHAEAAAGRIKRRRATALHSLNLAFLLRHHSDRPVFSTGQYCVFLVRRLIAEMAKDLLSRRFSLPQVRGLFLAMRHLLGLMRVKKSNLEPWYIDIQNKILQS